MTDDRLSKLEGLSEDELRRLGSCAVCRQPLLAPGRMPLFFLVELTRAGFDVGALQQRLDLEMMLGNSKRVVVHDECAGSVARLAMLMEDDE